MSFDMRSPFSLNTSWTNTSPRGPDAYDQKWITVTAGSNFQEQTGAAGVAMLHQQTLIESTIVQGIGAGGTYVKALGGHTFRTNFQSYTASGDEALAAVDNRGSAVLTMVPQRGTGFSVNTDDSRSLIFAMME